MVQRPFNSLETRLPHPLRSSEGQDSHPSPWNNSNLAVLASHAVGRVFSSR